MGFKLMIKKSNVIGRGRFERERPKLLKAASDKSEVEELAEEYARIERDIANIRSTHSHVFEQIEELETAKEERRLKIQLIARKKAIQGKTVRLVNNKYVQVQVCGNQSAEQYDYLKAVRYWPAEVLHRVLRVDAKEVSEVIKDGEISDKLLQRALLPREAKTPAVTIKVKMK